MSNTIDHDELQELKLKFFQFAKEKIEHIESLILKAEAVKKQETSKTALRDILSLSHSLKGAARGYKLDAFITICNKLEDYIAELLNHEKIVSAEELTKMLKHTDLLANYGDEFTAKKNVDDAAFLDRYQKIFSANILQKAAVKQVEEESQAQLHVLVVGVNKAIMKQVHLALGNFKYTASFAPDALEALHRLSLEKFDLVISSYMMDPIDGLSLTLAVKNQWRDKAPRMVLLCSEPITMKYDKELLPEQTFIKSMTLPQEMEAYFRKEFATFSKETKPLAKKAKYKVKTIYFVEDDPNILDLCLVVFTEKKDVILFNEVTKSDPYQRMVQIMPDLIICDIHVPNVDTLQLLVKIKTSEELSKIPVVFFSGDPEQPMASKLLKIGAMAVLDKTTILTSMIEELEKLGIELQTSA